jgi:DNA ligase-4
MLIFFDLLCIDGESLLEQPYDLRRSLLEGSIKTIEGFSAIAEREEVRPKQMSEVDSVVRLQRYFAQCIAGGNGTCLPLQSNHRFLIEFDAEGLVLKGSNSLYNDLQLPWVKVGVRYPQMLGTLLTQPIDS